MKFKSEKPRVKNVNVQPVVWGPAMALFGLIGALLISQTIVVTLADYKYGGLKMIDSEWIQLALDTISGLLSVGIVVLLIKIWRNNIAELGFKSVPLVRMLYSTFITLFFYVATAVVVFNVLAIFVPETSLNQDQNLGYSQDLSSIESLWPIFIGLVIVAPFVEELLFRGFLFKGFRHVLSFWPAAIAAALLFALAHQQFNVGVDVFILAIAASWLFEKFNSIWPAILLHSAKNTIAFILVFILNVS